MAAFDSAAFSTDSFSTDSFDFESGAAFAVVLASDKPLTDRLIRAGGAALTLTVSGDTFVDPFDNTARQSVIDALDAAAATNGWGEIVQTGLTVSAVTRTSDTVVTVALPPFPGYDPRQDELMGLATTSQQSADIFAARTFPYVSNALTIEFAAKGGFLPDLAGVKAGKRRQDARKRRRRTNTAKARVTPAPEIRPVQAPAEPLRDFRGEARLELIRELQGQIEDLQARLQLKRTQGERLRLAELQRQLAERQRVQRLAMQQQRAALDARERSLRDRDDEEAIAAILQMLAGL